MLVLNFSEKPAGIVRRMDEARRQDAAQYDSCRKQLRWFALFIPAGAAFVVLDALIGAGVFALSWVAVACWLAALVGWQTIRKNPHFKDSAPAIGREPTGSGSGSSCTSIFVGFLLAISILFFIALLLLQLEPAASVVVQILLMLVITVFLAGLFIRLWLRRSPDSDFGPKFDLARTVFESLKDDVAPKRTFTGWLDLTGLEQQAKRVRERSSSSSMPVAYYRDEWLRLKAPLYDGSQMRVSAVQRTKARLGRWKTSMHGRRKWKPGGLVQAREFLQVALIPNPQTQVISAHVPPFFPEGAYQLGSYILQSFKAVDGRLECEAVSYKPVQAQDLLELMRYVHSFLQPVQPG